MINFIVIDKYTGSILRSGSCVADMTEYQAVEENESVKIGTANDETDYFDLENEAVTPKQTNTTILDTLEINADGIDQATFSSIPVGSEIFLNGQSLGICNDGEFEFSTDVIGSNRILIQKVEYLDYQVTINAI
jgi:hypothetical protein